MMVIMVHWRIKKATENEQAVEAMWKIMTIQPSTGLYREVLTRQVFAVFTNTHALIMLAADGG